MIRCITVLILALIITAVPQFVAAHVYKGMGTQITVTDDVVKARLQIAVVDSVLLAPEYDTNRDGRLTATEYRDAEQPMADAHAKNFHVSSDGKPMVVSKAEVEVESTEGFTDEPHALIFNIEYKTADGGPVGTVTANPNVFRGLTISPITQKPIVAAQRNIITVDDRGKQLTIHSDGRATYQGSSIHTADAQSSLGEQASVDASVMEVEEGESEDAVASSGMSSAELMTYFLKEGFLHIIFGWDHVLFVIALVAMATSMMNLLKVITAFTVAHAVTICLVASGIINIESPKHLEAFIAATIAYVALENLIRVDKGISWRWALVFAFGLLHGLAFAGNLRALFGPSASGYTGNQIAASLLTFNIGVELGQVLIILIVFPIIQWLRKAQPVMARRAVIGVSMIVFFFGVSLVVDKTLAPGKLPWLEWMG